MRHTATAAEEPPSDPVERLRAVVAAVRHWLPSQGPIAVFVHHNTLHSFEHMPFEDAVEHVARRNGAQPYLPHEEYLAAWRAGRISDEAVERALADRTAREGASFFGVLTRTAAERHALRVPFVAYSAASLTWTLAERGPDGFPGASGGPLGGAAKRELLQALVDRIDSRLAAESPAPSLAGDGALATEVDRLTAQFLGAFLDLGAARWELPGRKHGLLAAAAALGLVEASGATGPELVVRLFEERGIEPPEWENAVFALLRPIAGWAGMVATLEEQPELAPAGHPRASLVELVALRLALGAPTDMAAPVLASTGTAMIAQAFGVLCRAGIDAKAIVGAHQSDVATFCRALGAFDDVARRRVLHRAYEETFQRGIVAALSGRPAVVSTQRPKFQAIFCLDEREESMRRHVEEAEPACQTFGAPGFFGVAVAFRAAGAERTVDLCPVVVKPQHVVAEAGSADRPPLARLDRAINRATRGLVPGHAIAAAAGLLAGVPLILQVTMPRAAMRLGAWLGWGAMRPERPLAIDATGGFTVAEMADRVGTFLDSIGIGRRTARLVFVIGHGSRTANNPFASAYECGACGGNRGDRNARIFAAMANDPRVRAELAARGAPLPDDTWFLGGCHDTCSDAIDLFDLALVPETLRRELGAARATLDAARAENARERTRRFPEARFGMAPAAALAHVERRSASLREARPEFGHGSNAALIIGPRALTRGLFLDRRSFLLSYDEAGDPFGEILSRHLGAAIPVCAGICLEYYFSRVDNRVYGAGTKLPHNPVAMLGVMDGAASDLRTGLPWQTVEIHEPMRPFAVIVAPRAKVAAAFARVPDVLGLVARRWVRVVVLGGHDEAPAWFDGRGFVTIDRLQAAKLRVFSRSRDYFDGTRDHLGPVVVGRESAC